MESPIFSENWYKVSKLKVTLLHTVAIQKQFFRGEEWYVLKDTLNNNFFKLKPEAYNFIVRFKIDKSVEENWLDSLEYFADSTPTQEEVVQLLSQLHNNNLLYFESLANTKAIFDKYKDKKKKELKNKLISFLYIKIPLFDPEKFLLKSKKFIDAVVSIKGLVVWFFIIILGLNSVIENIDKLSDETEGILATSNLVLLYISIVFLKLLHEFGHSFVVKRFGGSVHTLGVMFLIFTPLPYMDASSSWFFRNKWHRALVGAAGMIVELFIAAIAAIIWAESSDGIVHSISFNIMLIGSVSSLLFNGNPLLRFDSYYMLSDILEIPNLYKRSRDEWYYVIQKYIFKIPKVISSATTAKERFWLLSYGLLSTLYRLLIAVGIALFIADKWFLLGVIVIITSVYMWILKPIFTFLHYILFHQSMKNNRTKSLSITLSVVLLFILFIFYVPIPYAIRVPGIVYQNGFTPLYAPTEGYLQKSYFKNGERVAKGDLLLVLSNQDIKISIKDTLAKIDETNAMFSKSLNKDIADMIPLQRRLKLLKEKLEFLQKQKSDLSIYATVDGVWVSKDLDVLENTWLKKRQYIGTIVPNKASIFIAVVSQEKSFNIFNKYLKYGEIKIRGDEDEKFSLKNVRVIPYQKKELPSAALGWLADGSVPVSNKEGNQALENFFEIRANIVNENNSTATLHGRTGIARFSLQPMSLGKQIYIFVEQLLQKRYRV